MADENPAGNSEEYVTGLIGEEYADGDKQRIPIDIRPVCAYKINGETHFLRRIWIGSKHREELRQNGKWAYIPKTLVRKAIIAEIKRNSQYVSIEDVGKDRIGKEPNLDADEPSNTLEALAQAAKKQE